MGNSNPQKQKSSALLAVNHPKFRQNQIQQGYSQLDAQIMRTCLSIEHDSIYTQWQQNVTRLAIDDQNLLLPKSYEFIRNTICGSSGILKVDYDNYPYLLSDQIQNRAPSKKYFEEQQLWYLLFVTVSNAQQFSHYQKKLGDIRPSNMFINDTGQLKTTCLYTFPGEKTNYQKTLVDNQLTYLSPEQVAQVKMSRAEPVSNPMLSQSFSIGLSILQSGILQNMSKLYSDIYLKSDKDSQNTQYSNVFNYQLLEKYLNQWMNLTFHSREKNREIKYCDPLKYAILGMCNPNPQNRYSSKQIYEWLRPHEVDIVNLHQFSIGMPNLKRENSVNKLTGNSSDINKRLNIKQSVLPNAQIRVNNHIQDTKKDTRPPSVRESSVISLNSSKRKFSATQRDNKNLDWRIQNSTQNQGMAINRKQVKRNNLHFKYPAQVSTRQNAQISQQSYSARYSPAKIVAFNGVVINQLKSSGRKNQQRNIGSNISTIQNNRQHEVVNTQNVRSFMGSLNSSPLVNNRFVSAIIQQNGPMITNFTQKSKQGNAQQKNQNSSGKSMGKHNLSRFRNIHSVNAQQKGQPVSFEYYLAQNKTYVSGFDDRRESKSPQKNDRAFEDVLKKIDEQLQKSKAQFPSDPSLKILYNSNERLRDLAHETEIVNEQQSEAK